MNVIEWLVSLYFCFLLSLTDCGLENRKYMSDKRSEVCMIELMNE